MARGLLRAAISLASIAALFAALALSGAVTEIWHATLVAVAAFYVGAHVIPQVLFRYQSMPYTYQLPNNWGARGFELQNVTYAAYHTVWYNHVTHAAFPIEAWLWLVVIAHFGGALACGAAFGVLALQALSFGERGFGIAMCALWAGFAATAALAAEAWPGDAYLAAQFGLVGFGFWRFTGHFVEPLPPGVVGNVAFVPAASAWRDPRVLRAAALGYLSEFSAGLPFRLFNSWAFLVAQSLGYAPRHAIDWNRARALATRIHAEGWGAQPTTAQIVVAAHALRDGAP